MSHDARVQHEPLPEFTTLSGQQPAVLTTTFLLGGRGAVATGAFDTGLQSLWLDGSRVLESLGVHGTHVESAHETPIGIERLLRGDRFRLSERIFVPSDAPLCVIEWRALESSGSVAISWRSPRARMPAEKGAAGILLDENALAVWSAPSAAELEVAPESGGDRILARLAVSPPDVIRLVISIAGRDSAEPSVLVRARIGSLARAAAEQMAVRSPDAAFNARIQWAQAQLPALAATRVRTLAAKALLACGNANPARDLLRQRTADDTAGDDVPAAPASPPASLHGQYLAWTGDASLVSPRGAVPRAERLESWPDATERAEAFVAAVNHVVESILGIQPDAMRHRLTLKPCLPAEWEFFEVERIRMGDALVSFRYRRAGDEHVVQVEQPAGAVPVRLILELALPARGLPRASVDGQPATLDARLVGGRLLVPVQLVLDAPRELRLVTLAG